MKIVRYLTGFFAIATVNICLGQVPPIQWQKTYGNSGNEVLHSIVSTADGNYLVMGIADVNGGDVSCSLKGLHDVWVYKMTPSGNVIWQQCFGGSKEEANPYNKIIATSDGGSLFISESWSKDFDATGHHKYSDVLTIKLDASGNIQWKHSFGGKKYDVPRALLELPGKRYVIVSRSTSSDGDVPDNIDPLKFDAWVFILDKNGNIISNHVYGGTGDDDLHQILQTADGNLLLFGFSSSQDGDLAGLSTNGTDGWLLKIDTLGNVLDSRVYGQANKEEMYDALKTNDGGYMVFGVTENPIVPVDKGSYHGDDDLWAVKLDNAYNMQWQGVYGGSDRETMMQGVIAPGNSGYYLAGGTYSDDGDVTKPYGNGNDEYVIKISPAGTLLWSFTHGGTAKDYANGITPTGLIVGVVYSTDGDVQNPKGNGDGWIYKFKDSKNGMAARPSESDDFALDGQPVFSYPNPASDVLNIQLQYESNSLTIMLSDLTGRTVYRQAGIDAVDKLTYDIPVSGLPAGIYMLRVSGDILLYTEKIMVMH